MFKKVNIPASVSGPTLDESTENLDVKESLLKQIEETNMDSINPAIIIEVQTLIIKYLKLKVKKKLPDIIKNTLDLIQIYVKNNDDLKHVSTNHTLF